jgi:hypothetical protein
MLVDPLTEPNVLVAVIVAVPVAVGVNTPVDEMFPPVAAHVAVCGGLFVPFTAALHCDV